MSQTAFGITLWSILLASSSFLFVAGRVRSIALSVSVCLSVCLLARLSQKTACPSWMEAFFMCFVYYKQQRAIRPLTGCNKQQYAHGTMLKLCKTSLGVFQQVIVIQRCSKFTETCKISADWKIVCYMWLWFGVPLTTRQYVMYFRFCG